ncbi:MAG: cytochrome C oxidase subunit IV family protein [Actinomycetota bacterium]
MSHQVEPAEAAELHHHPTPRKYVTIAVILALITAVEVGIYYVESIHVVLVPSLITFAFLKFFLVATWFMHLRFDSKLFRRLFVTGLVLALIVFTIVLVTFFTHLGGPTPDVAG